MEVDEGESIRRQGEKEMRKEGRKKGRYIGR